MKRVIFLVMAALLAMLILVPMAVAQDTTARSRAGPYGAGGEPALSWLSALWSPRGWRPLSRR
jgi:hypothetical protein